MLLPLWAQTNKQMPIQESYQKIEEMDNRLSNIEKLMDSKMLEHRLEAASEIIRWQDTQINTIQLFLLGVSIFIAVFIPVFTYLFAIKPAKEATEKLKVKFLEFLKGYEIKQIDQAIENTKSTDKHVRQSASLYLSLNQYFPFEDRHLFKIHKMLSDPQIEDSIKGVLALLLSNRKSEYADEYFTKLMQSNTKSDTLVYYALKYFATVGIKNYLEAIAEYVLNTNESYNRYINCASTLAYMSKEALSQLINNKRISENLNPDIRKKVYWHLQNIGSTYRIEKEIENSLIVKLIKGNKEVKEMGSNQ